MLLATALLLSGVLSGSNATIAGYDYRSVYYYMHLLFTFRPRSAVTTMTYVCVNTSAFSGQIVLYARRLCTHVDITLDAHAYWSFLDGRQQHP